LHTKFKNGEELTDYESYLKTFLSAAIEQFLSNNVAHMIFCSDSLPELQEMIMDIMSFRYGDLVFNIPNNRKLVSIEVFLNSNGHNAKHERFVAYVSEKSILECFNSTSEWNLCGQSVMELREHKREIAIYYFMYLAELELSGFDFSKDSRMLNLSEFWIGLY